jgi:two-component system sensor histidine kinase BaeS
MSSGPPHGWAGARASICRPRRGVVEVTDTRIGIAPEHLPHLFERFYRVDKARSRTLGGHGIGLTISKAFVEAHGGRIWAASDGPGRGATFTFTLPRQRP